MSTTEQNMAKLKERMNREQVSWVPETAGQNITIEVVEVSEQEGEYGPFLMVYGFNPEEPDKEYVIRGFGSVLAGHLARLEPRVGDVMSVRFNGEKTSKNPGPNGKPRTYKDFTVKCMRGENQVAAPNFDSLAKAAALAMEQEGITVDDDGNEF